MTAVGVSELVDSWEIALKTERKAASTRRVYVGSVRLYLDWAATNGHPDEINRRHAQLWIAELLDAGAEATTVKVRQGALRRFSAWLTEEREIDTDPLLGLKAPKIDIKVVEPLTEAELLAMLKTCDRKTFTGIRDEALIRFMNETVVRAGEVIAMAVEDLNVTAGTAIIRRGKGGKGRLVAYGPKTAQALDRYQRARRRHRHADVASLWLAQRGPTFGYWSLRKTLSARATKAGVKGFHLHKTRHTGATRWLAAGGSEGGLMAVAGWSQRSMLDRYTQATAQTRAAEESRRLELGDL